MTHRHRSRRHRPSRPPGATKNVTENPPRVLDRAGRARKARTLKVAAAVAGLVGAGLFTGLAMASSQATARQHVVPPDQQLSRLEQSNNGAFFSVGGSNVPSPGNGAGQTSSGGS